jgi:RimJ/RimL family protein N-acetyltransferase
MLHPPRSAEGYRRWTAEQATMPFQGEQFRLAIEPVAEQCLVGVIHTHHCEPQTGNFSYGITVDRACQRRGYASEAIVLLLLRFMFAERRYQKCNVGIHADNAASLALHTKLGFIEEGRRRRAEFLAGRYCDEVLLGLTVEEFTARHPFSNLTA